MSIDIRENIKNGVYKPKREYPQRPKKPRQPMGKDATSEAFKKYAEDLESWENEMAQYKSEQDAYSKEQAECHNQFEKDCCEVEGITNHPHCSKIYAKAYQDGHSYGHSEVIIHLEDLCSFLRDIEAL